MIAEWENDDTLRVLATIPTASMRARDWGGIWKSRPTSRPNVKWQSAPEPPAFSGARQNDSKDGGWHNSPVIKPYSLDQAIKPMRQILPRLALLCLMTCPMPSFAGEHKSALATVQDFYARFLAYYHEQTPGSPRPEMTFSKAFQTEIAKTAEACRKYGEGPCGWGSGGDEYLDAQESDPALTYANSGITFREIAPGTIRVRLNVYPSQTDAGNYYLRTITFRMLKRQGAYVVDDIIYADGPSSRKQLSEERRQLLAPPQNKATPAGNRMSQ